MKPMPPKDQRALLASLEAQGATIIKRKDGVTVRYPDGSTSNVHRTHGDRRSRLNLRAEVRRAGLVWPFDDHPKKPKEH